MLNNESSEQINENIIVDLTNPDIDSLPKNFNLMKFDDGLTLDCDIELPSFEIAYETFGTLNEKRTNVVWICHALTGDSHVTSGNSNQPGWWEDTVGPGKAIDTNKFFVVCSNVLGGCSGSSGPTSINPTTGQIYGPNFPLTTIGDMVRAQVKLADELGIKKICAVVGGSMGGMQALEWAIEFPERVHSVVIAASTARLSAQAIAFNEVGRRAILDDPNFAGGNYLTEGTSPDKGLSIARMIGHITYLSDESMWHKFGRRLQHAERFTYGYSVEFQVESYLEYQGQRFIERFDANSYLIMTKATDYFDAWRDNDNLATSFRHAPDRFLILSYSSDWLFPTYQAQEIVDGLISAEKNVTFAELTSPFGHDSFLLEYEQQSRFISPFLENSLITNSSQTGIANKFKCEPRADYCVIEKLAANKQRVLDIGCGNGQLLRQLIDKGAKKAVGIDNSIEHVSECLDVDVFALFADADNQLDRFADDSFDIALLSLSLQVLTKPADVVRQMLRIAPNCIVTFPNFANYKHRWQLAINAKMPMSKMLPFTWDETPNIHHTTISDFKKFASKANAKINKVIPLASKNNPRAKAIRFFSELRAETFVVSLSRDV